MLGLGKVTRLRKEWLDIVTVISDIVHPEGTVLVSIGGDRV